jgi:3-phosphoshikimate 1-carboxyvinyltransferase
MTINLERSKVKSNSEITITGSKSESNRMLILQAIYPKIKLENLSNSDDTQLMIKALASSSELIDIHHAGTAMRFLTAYFATEEGREVILTGSDRMKERPIKILVDALKKLGADISYLDQQGYPPIKIKGKRIIAKTSSLNANVSSQYISALLLNAVKLEHGLDLSLEGEITSFPYIQMTLGLLRSIGVEAVYEHNHIKVLPFEGVKNKFTFAVESDWSSASYFYSIIALSEIGTKVTLSHYKKGSLQGDSILTEIYRSFGVTTQFGRNSITLIKVENHDQSNKKFNLNNVPDIAQTIAVTCLGLGISCHLTGLHTLKIKETDRLEAMKTEIEKFGGKVKITEDEFMLFPCSKLNKNISVETYHDHRMAMAFGPLATKVTLKIKDADVVSKSYPDYWNDLSIMGIYYDYS